MPQCFLRSLGIRTKYIAQNESLPVHVINVNSGGMSMDVYIIDELLILATKRQFPKWAYLIQYKIARFGCEMF